MLSRIILTICTLIIFSGYCQAKLIAHDFKARTSVNASIRSLALPGWGQFFNEQHGKGYIILGATILTLADSFILAAKADSAYSDYTNTGVVDGPLYAEYENQQGQAALVSYICAAVWLYAVVDAFIYGSSTDNELSKAAGFSIASNSDSAGLYYSIEF